MIKDLWSKNAIVYRLSVGTYMGANAASRQRCFVLAVRAAIAAAFRAAWDEREIERQMSARQVLAVTGRKPFERQIDLADQQASAALLEDGAHLRDDLVNFGLIRVVDR
jgi:hypothetical protein